MPDQERRRLRNCLDLIGKTPLVKLSKVVADGGANIFAKLESFNPGGSIKDRVALAMIEDAEEKGLIGPGATIIEPTSGNTGIGLALVGAVKGYKVILVVSENINKARRAFLESFGGIIETSEAIYGMKGIIRRAEELVAENEDYFMPQQFDNPANPEVHRRTTGPEIIADMAPGNVDALVAGIGTGGTITGVAQALNGHFENTRIVGVEPAASAVLSGGPAGPHMIEGIGPGFRAAVLDMDMVDEVRRVSDDDAFRFTARLAAEEGLKTSASSGAALCAACDLAREMGPGKNIVVILPSGA